MKKLFSILTIALTLVIFTSCEDEDKTRVPFGDPVQPGAWVIMDVTTPFIDGNDINNAAYEFTLSAPSNNVASYDLEVRRTAFGSSTVTDFVPLRSVTSFPSDERITAQDLADAFGINVSEVGLGDAYEFVASSTGTDGSIVNVNNASQDIVSESGQKAAYSFSALIVCPLPTGYFSGDYQYTLVSTDNGFGPVFGNDQPVVVVEKNVFQRTMSVEYLQALGIGAPPIDFEINFLCGDSFPTDNQSSNLSCGGGIFLSNGGAVTYDESDDTSLDVNILEDFPVGSGCGGDYNSVINLAKL